MLKLFKGKKFPTTIFIIASIANFILLGSLFFFFKVKFDYDKKLEKEMGGKYYLNNNFNDGDSLITRIPSLKDMLAGPIISDFDPALGSKKAEVNIVYFSDFKCNYCQKQENVIKQIIDNYKNEVRLIWKDYPESDIYSESFKAAIAARCAQEQGKFWQYHDLLYENENSFNKDLFISLAQEAGLKTDLFSKCLDDIETAQLIKDNILEAQALDINGIPFIYINNQEVMGEVSYEDLEKMIKIELGKLIDYNNNF